MRYMILSFTALDVTIQISNTSTYHPSLGPNEYRAASGPYRFTCLVEGKANGNLTYMWNSTCTDCKFRSETSDTIIRTALLSSDNGTHTCTVHEEVSESSGSASIEMNIVGK